jgi:hypothetical protein
MEEPELESRHILISGRIIERASVGPEPGKIQTRGH